MEERIGQQFGNYRTIRLLGRGGFAEVYLGEQIYLKTLAAIKLLSNSDQLTEKDLEQFRSEAKTIANLNHPHVVKVHDFGIEKETNIPYLVMEYAPNGTLRQLYPNGSVLHSSDMLSYVEQVSEALQYAHDQNLIHRDVKPENMLLTNNNRLLLSDFGIAVIAHSTESQVTENTYGTLVYMAPEQIQGKPRPASDQYSLAIVIYEWMCGVRPFGGLPNEVVYQQLLVPPTPLREKNPSISPLVEEVVLKALAKEPKERFETVKAFYLALEEAFKTQDSIEIYSTEPQISSPTHSTKVMPSNGTILQAIDGRSTAVAWSPNSTCIVWGDEYDGTVHVWDILEKRETRKYKGHSQTMAVVWANDGGSIFSGGAEGTIQRWDIRTGRRIFKLQAHSDVIRTLALSPNGAGIASGGDDRKVCVLSTMNQKIILQHSGHSKMVYSVSWSPDGDFIASADFDSIQIWEITTKKEIYTFYYAKDGSSAIEKVLWSPNGSYIASCRGYDSIKVWEPFTGNVITNYGNYPYSSTGAFAWSSDGILIASAVQDEVVKDNQTTYIGKKIHVWEVATGKYLFSCEGHTQSIRDIAWSPDGKYLVSCAWDRKILIWQVS